MTEASPSPADPPSPAGSPPPIETTAPPEDDDAAIVVAQPGPGSESTSPLRVAGTADVYEATVQLELRANGRRLARDFTTATCGSGCRGSFETTLGFSVSSRTEATLVLFEESAEDGSCLNVVRVPVVLLP